MVGAVKEALSKLREAKSRDEGEARADELQRAARESVDEAVDLFHTTQGGSFALVWCLHGLSDSAVLDLYKQVMKHKDQYVRWAAVEGLKYSSHPTLIPVFIAALKDRSHLVKGVAVEWLKLHGDSNAIEPLERVSKLPSLIRNAPGIVRQASEAVCLLRAKAT